ncbi:Dihydrodipicolinate synthetase family protein [Aspergillus niger]|uniref:Dihydrodipicolinate synthetase family protein n=1 Tax=Aspergillus niger TaxID=5061 RepID=A0A505IL62_ASPNG|nr:Dihydrodipicolinate synthetase family protein [Aspergillus niger]
MCNSVFPAEFALSAPPSNQPNSVIGFNSSIYTNYIAILAFSRETLLTPIDSCGFAIHSRASFAAGDRVFLPAREPRVSFLEAALFGRLSTSTVDAHPHATDAPKRGPRTTS